MSPMTNNAGCRILIPAEESAYPVEVQRVDDEDGAFVCLFCRPEEDGSAEDEDILADGFFVAFSLENAARLGEVLRALTAVK